MRLRRIEIRDFRKLRHVAVDNLGDGLNVLVGDNEAGKSTLLAALRAVLFERHRVGGVVAAAMQPHGSSVRPEIAIDFELSGGLWRLRKAFCQRPEAELVDPAGNRTSGDAVEDRLVDLLGFTPSGRGERKPEEHHGIFGLLWVEQASAHQALSAGASRGTLAAALESEVGQVMGGGRGRTLLAEADKRRDAFWDKRTPPKPKGDWKQRRDELDGLEGTRADLAARLATHDEKVAALSRIGEALGRHVREDRQTLAAKALEAAQAAHLRVTQLEATLAVLAKAHADAVLLRTAAVERTSRRDALAGQAETQGRKATSLGEDAARLRADLGRAEAATASAQARFGEGRRMSDEAERLLRELDAALMQARARAMLRQARERLGQAERIAEALRLARAALAGLRIGKKDVAELDRLIAERDAARIKRDAASVQILAEPDRPDTPVTIDGRVQPPGDAIRLAADATLTLPGFGRIQVRPGGGAAALARAVDSAEAAVAARLAELGVGTREGAADRLTRRVELEAEAASHARVLEALVPEGLEVLRQEVETLQASAGPGDQNAAAPTSSDRDAAARRRDLARQAAGDLEREARRLEKDLSAAATAAALAEERMQVAVREHETSLRALAAARAEAPDEHLRAQVQAAERAEAQAGEALAQGREAYEHLSPEAVELELDRAKAADAAIRADIAALTRDKRDLEIELRTLGRDGLGEQLGEIEGRLETLREQVAARDLEAEAALLLHRTLLAAQSETRERWLGPVRERVRPYLRLVQPDSDILLNDTTFSIEHLVRGGVQEPFESLSVGAREQVAVITRLALADILRASGQPAAIILDDALVNTDEGRLGRMHLVLRKAAQSLQVLVLTCRERDFIDLGAPIRRL